MAGNGSALPVHSFLVDLEHFHTQTDVYDVLSRSLAPGSGVYLHEVNKLTDHIYRISVHVAPAERGRAESLVRELLQKGLLDGPRMVEISTEDRGVLGTVGQVARDTGTGILNDIAGVFRGVTSTIGGGASDLLGGSSVAVVLLALGTLAIGAVVLSKRSA